MHMNRFRYARRRRHFRKPHTHRGRLRTRPLIDPSARIQPLDPDFDSGCRAFLEGWLRAEVGPRRHPDDVNS